MNKRCSPITDEYWWPRGTNWRGFAQLINPGTQTREPGAPLRSCYNLSGGFRSLLRLLHPDLQFSHPRSWYMKNPLHLFPVRVLRAEHMGLL